MYSVQLKGLCECVFVDVFVKTVLTTVTTGKRLKKILISTANRWLFMYIFNPSQKKLIYRIYSIKRPGHLLNFWTLRVGAYWR